MAYQIHASGTFQSGHWSIQHTRLIIVFACHVFHRLGMKKE